MGPLVGMERDMKAELQRVAEWARERLRSGAEPPTAYYRLMQLVEAADALQDGLMATPRAGDSLEAAQPAETAAPPTGEVVHLRSARHHQGTTPVNLPT